MKTLFGTTTVSDIHKLRDILAKLYSRNSYLFHPLTGQLTCVRKLNTVTAANADAIANLSGIVKDKIDKSHDTFQKIT